MNRNRIVLIVIVAIVPFLTGFISHFKHRSFFYNNDAAIYRNSFKLFKEGRHTFRHDTFGSEGFWGETLKLHQAIAGEDAGGVGPGVDPATALAVGLKVDSDALPRWLKRDIKRGQVDLESPVTTLALLELDAVIGVKGHFDEAGQLTTMGIQCALCHSTVDDSFSPGIGKRLDGWPNRDLNVGAIISLAPDLSSVASLLATDQSTVRDVLATWGPGKFDAGLLLDGKAFRPDGKTGATLIPPAYGLAGVNLATYTGWGSVPYWNGFVSNLEMHGHGTFLDPRLNNPDQFPIAAAIMNGSTRNSPDLTTKKLAALHYYQLSIPAPKPPHNSYDKYKASQGELLFNNKARCAECHVPPLYTEPGYNLRTPEEIGIDSFTADRSPTGKYRTTPLGGLGSRTKGGYYHDGRFATLTDVVNHYDTHFNLGLDSKETDDLVEFLKSL